MGNHPIKLSVFVLFLVLGLGLVSAAVHYAPPVAFTVTTDGSAFYINTIDDTIKLTIAEKGTGATKTNTGMISIKPDETGRVKLNLDNSENYKYYIVGKELSAQSCTLQYGGLTIDLCKNDTENKIQPYTGFFVADAGTSVYSSGIVSVSGTGNTLNGIAAAMGNGSVFQCLGANCYTNTSLQINTSGSIVMTQGQTLTIGRNLYVYGTFDINRAFVYMNDTDSLYNGVTVYGGGILNVTGTAVTDYVPVESSTFDAGIQLSSAATATPHRWSLIVSAAGKFYSRDAKFSTVIPSTPYAAIANLRRVWVSNANFFSIGFLFDATDTVHYSYFTNSYKNGNNPGNSYFSTRSGAAAALSFNMTQISVNVTGGAAGWLIDTSRANGNEINNQRIDGGCSFYLYSDASYSSSFRLVNMTFLPAYKISTCTYTYVTYNHANKFDFLYPLNIYTTDQLGQPIAAPFTVEQRKYGQGALLQDWTTILTSTTGTNGKYGTIRQLLAKRIVFSNESYRYLYRIKVTGTENQTNRTINLTYDSRSKQYNFSVVLKEKYQLVATDLIDESSINLSRVGQPDLVRAYYQSSNLSNSYIGFYANGTLKSRFYATNNTWGSFNLENLTLGRWTVHINTSKNATISYHFTVVNISLGAAPTYDEQAATGLYPGLAGFLALNCLLIFVGMYLVNDLKANWDLITVKKSGDQNVLTLRADMILRFCGIFLLLIMGLVVSGYAYFASIHIHRTLGNLAFVFVILNLIAIILSVVVAVLKAFTIPFMEVRQIVDDMVQEGKYRR
jgi:hypothetical protein